MTDNNKGDYAVLFVDDEEKALKYFDKAVGGRFPVLTASDVDTAIAILQEKSDHIAVVVSDQRMPGKNGVELLKYVRQHHPGIIRLLTTAYSDLNDAIEAINRGEIYRYIQKPWHVESLQAEIVGAMNYFLLRRERDLLLAEKLSTRQRMTDVQRLAQLIVYGQTLQNIPNVDYGLQNFLELLPDLPGERESDNLIHVDQWELTRWESKRASEFFNALLPKLSLDYVAESQTVSSDQLEALLHQVAATFDLELSVNRAAKLGDLNGHSQSVSLLLQAVCELLALSSDGNQIPACQIRPTSAPYYKGDATSLMFTLQQARWPTERHLLSGSAMTAVHPAYQHVLTASIIAATLGGKLKLELDEQRLAVEVVLPQSSQPLPELGWDWQTDVLPAFEPAIEEFYPEL